MTQRPTRTGNTVRGVALLARGRAAGLAEFAGTREAFLASLAPLIAFPLVGAGLIMASGQPVAAASDFLATLCALLVPPVLSHMLAERWERAEAWLRYAVAFNWCQWAIPVVAVGLMSVLALAVGLGFPSGIAGAVVLLLLLAYGLWLHWFLAVHGLHLSGARAALLVVVVNVGTGLLVLAPHLLGFAGGPDLRKD
jgi:hypothetical protein